MTNNIIISKNSGWIDSSINQMGTTRTFHTIHTNIQSDQNYRLIFHVSFSRNMLQKNVFFFFSPALQITHLFSPQQTSYHFDWYSLSSNSHFCEILILSFAREKLKFEKFVLFNECEQFSLIALKYWMRCEEKKSELSSGQRNCTVGSYWRKSLRMVASNWLCHFKLWRQFNVSIYFPFFVDILPYSIHFDWELFSPNPNLWLFSQAFRRKVCRACSDVDFVIVYIFESHKQNRRRNWS